MFRFIFFDSDCYLPPCPPARFGFGAPERVSGEALFWDPSKSASPFTRSGSPKLPPAARQVHNIFGHLFVFSFWLASALYFSGGGSVTCKCTHNAFPPIGQNSRALLPGRNRLNPTPSYGDGPNLVGASRDLGMSCFLHTMRP